MVHFITRAPPADGGYPVDTERHEMTDDGCPHGTDPARWDDRDWRDNLGEWDTFDDEERLVFPITGGAVAGVLLPARPAPARAGAAAAAPAPTCEPNPHAPRGRTTYLRWLFAALLVVGVAAAAGAQPPLPYQPPFPPPGPVVPASPVDGPWFFRGDPWQPCFVQTVPGPRGPVLVFTNEKRTRAFGWLSRDGRRVTIPDWNLTGTVRGNALVWPNGDFWAR